MRAVVLCGLVGGLLGLGFIACNPNSIGRPCVNPGGQAVLGTQVSSPALECPSRLCLLQPASAADAGFRATCTAFCDRNSDCEAETKSECANGFVCAVATQSGPFCCRKLCVCKDDLVVGENIDHPEGSVITPFSCDPKQNSQITCSNVKQ